jgi:Uncharacterized alpha/beta hydrolase domain (DUF2235)
LKGFDWLRERVDRQRPHGSRYDASLNHPPYHPKKVPRGGVRIEFLGLWDTVDAYGGPIEEMTRGWDRWIWPLSLRDKHLWSGVKKACHALALDDERQAFWPQLWTEQPEGKEKFDRHRHQSQRCHSVGCERISQVWFPGMHANVGGGYPEDSLSLVPFRWIVENAKKRGLKFRKDYLKPFYDRANALGTLHDSRRGFGVYYRYMPRRLDYIVEDDQLVNISLHKIHHSVFDRIGNDSTDYAPIVLPHNYAVVTKSGQIRRPTGKRIGIETPTQARTRVEFQEHVWDQVWRRRVDYFLIILVTLLFALMPWYSYLPRPFNLVEVSNKCGRSAVCFLSSLPQLVGSVLPGLSRTWVDIISANPGKSTILAGILAILLLRNRMLRHRIENAMGSYWKTHDACGWPERESKLVRRFRSNGLRRGLFNRWRTEMAPFIFGFGFLAALLIISTAMASKTWFSVTDALGKYCQAFPPELRRAVSGDTLISQPFSYKSACFPTGLLLEAGTHYRLAAITDARAAPKDSLAEVNMAGIQQIHPLPLAMLFGLFKRNFDANQLQLVARIIPDDAGYIKGQDDYVLNPVLPFAHGDNANELIAEFTAEKTGFLYLYANEAVLFDASISYSNNSGEAFVGIERARYNDDRGTFMMQRLRQLLPKSFGPR